MKRGVVLLLLVLAVASAGWAGARHLRRRAQLAGLPANPAADAPESVRRVLDPLRAAIVAEPLASDAWGAYGEALCANDYFPAAVSCLARAEQLNPGNSIWPHLRGVCTSVSDKKAAAEALRKAIAINPSQTTSMGVLAEILMDENADEEAYKLLAEAAKLDPRDPRFPYDLARLDLKAGRAEKALERLTPLLKSQRGRPDVHRIAAQIYRRLDRPKEADREGEIVKLLPKHLNGMGWVDQIFLSTSHYKRGVSWMGPSAAEMVRSGRAAEALEYLNLLSPAEREEPRIQVVLGKARIHLRQLDDAQTVLQGVVAKDPKFASAWFELGTLAMLREKWEDAAASFNKAVEFQSDMDAAAFNAALCYQQAGKKDLAVKSLEKAAEIAPSNSDALRLLAAVLIEKGDRKEAKRRIDAAMLLDPDDPGLKELAAKADAK